MEWFSRFSQEHLILSILLRLLIAVVIIAAAIALLGLICSFLYAIFKRIVVGFFNAINEKLNGLCAPRNKTSNPWGMVAALFVAYVFYNAPTVSSRGVADYWLSESRFGIPMHQQAGLIIVGLTILFGLFTARLRYPIVLFAKIVRIPLDLISIPFRFVYMITGIIGSLTGAIKSSEGTVYIGNGPVPVGGYSYSPGYSSDYQTAYQDSSGGYGESVPVYAQSSSSDGYAYLGEKNDQYRAMESGGADGYNYTSGGGSTQYFTGDYRPFSESGETVEVYHLDEGYVPMDND